MRESYSLEEDVEFSKVLKKLKMVVEFSGVSWHVKSARCEIRVVSCESL